MPHDAAFGSSRGTKYGVVGRSGSATGITDAEGPASKDAGGSPGTEVVVNMLMALPDFAGEDPTIVASDVPPHDARATTPTRGIINPKQRATLGAIDK